MGQRPLKRPHNGPRASRVHLPAAQGGEMLGKLLTLLLHAKSGAISGLFLLGATGALVSVSTQNGVTTITITEASPSPSASASASAHPSASPSASVSPKPSSSPNTFSSPKPADACADQAKALA